MRPYLFQHIRHHHLLAICNIPVLDDRYLDFVSWGDDKWVETAACHDEATCVVDNEYKRLGAVRYKYAYWSIVVCGC